MYTDIHKISCNSVNSYLHLQTYFVFRRATARWPITDFYKMISTSKNSNNNFVAHFSYYHEESAYWLRWI